MADYYSLLARAVANLPKTSPPSTRRAIYERARKALTNQLRSLKPQLPESDIAREERALDEAVSRLEAEFEPATAVVHELPLAAAATEAELAEPPPAPP
ncbi:MAG: histidine kinase, partial [Pseudomonadota bacterium]|nr:histidine kinase [Pseudomonadota bacterium]